MEMAEGVAAYLRNLDRRPNVALPPPQCEELHSSGIRLIRPSEDMSQAAGVDGQSFSWSVKAKVAPGASWPESHETAAHLLVIERAHCLRNAGILHPEEGRP